MAAGYQPHEVVFVSNVGGRLSAERLRAGKVREILTNSVRNLYLTHRAAFYEALMGGVILIPEGVYDYEWLSLWQRLAQSCRDSTTRFDLRPMTMLPTGDGAVAESFREIARFRPDAVPIVDGDAAGAKYVGDLIGGSPAPTKIIRYGNQAAVECLAAWILEPALSSPGVVLSGLIGSSSPELRNLQDALIANKKDREVRERIVWESLALDACCERACDFFQDVSLVASDCAPINAGWQSQSQANGTVVWVASQLRRV